MAGMRRLHTDAAIITPAAKPRNIFCTFPLMVLWKRKTIAAPRVVIRKVKPVPLAAQINDSAIFSPYPYKVVTPAL
ncbi:hypothetical protein D3C81_2003130 [compost metagenome]